jgi:hypothetical protein
MLHPSLNPLIHPVLALSRQEKLLLGGSPTLCVLCTAQVFRRLRKFFRRSISRDTPFDERLSHHEGREGHEDRTMERASNLKKVFFLRVLRALRGGDIHFSFGCGSPLFLLVFF